MTPTPVLPNSREAIEGRAGEAAVNARAVWGMLLLRPVLALGFQCLFARGYMLGGSVEPWRAAADWWLGSFALGEFINLWLLLRLAKREGLRYRDLLGVRKGEGKRDALWVVVALLVSGPLGFLPNVLLGGALWGNAQVGADLMFRPLPVVGAWAILVVFPVVHALTELPTYYGYVMPRLQAMTGRTVWPALLCAFVLGAQHVFLPLLVDLTNPPGGIGWNNRERMSLLDRGPADVALALALIHHLAIAFNVPFDMQAPFFAGAARRLVIEFVPKEDSQVQRLLQGREDVFVDYTRPAFDAAFGRYFNTIEAAPIQDGGRVLYLMEKKS